MVFNLNLTYCELKYLLGEKCFATGKKYCWFLPGICAEKELNTIPISV